MCDDYVINLNDSYWLLNFLVLFEGYLLIIGVECMVCLLCMWVGFVFMQELIDCGDKVMFDDIQQMFYSQWNYGVELFFDDVFKFCGLVNLVVVCDVFVFWDCMMMNELCGGYLWCEFWVCVCCVDDFWMILFDFEKLVEMLCGLVVGNGVVVEQLCGVLFEVEKVLIEVGFVFDVLFGEVQYVECNGECILILGGEGWVGMFSMIVM